MDNEEQKITLVDEHGNEELYTYYLRLIQRTMVVHTSYFTHQKQKQMKRLIFKLMPLCLMKITT
ncbi:Uncharacterised protein [Pediococcus pentosaceus]|nr:Uncharacterised protein [Pediococcus pentosaceus]